MITKYIQHVKIGQTVKVLSGNYKGTVGKILEINKKKSLASIDAIMPRIKALKQTTNNNLKEKEIKVFIHTSNLMFWNNLSV